MCIVCAQSLSLGVGQTGIAQGHTPVAGGYALTAHDAFRVALGYAEGGNHLGAGDLFPLPPAAIEVQDYSALLMGQHIIGPSVSGRPAFYTYSFPTTPPVYGDVGVSSATFAPFTEAERQAARAAIAKWADASGLTVFEVTQGRGDVEFMHFSLNGFSGLASSPGAQSPVPFPVQVFTSPGLVASDVWIQAGVVATEGLLLHEIGHALGFKHPSSSFIAPFDRVLPAALNTTQQTVMSLNGPLGGLGPLDLAAITYLYGPSDADGTQIASWNWDAATETLTQTGFALADTIVGVAASDIMFGEAGDDYLFGRAGADKLSGGEGADRLFGGVGNDLLIGGLGNDILNGGADLDLAAYSGVRRQYTANSALVSGNGEGADTLISVEGAVFVDGVLSFDRDGQAAQVMRLYHAALNRVPDGSGFEAVLDLLEGGQTLQQVASLFLNSPELQARFGALNNLQFIEQMYRFALRREGDAAGIQAWTDRLNTGTSRTEMLVIFSESEEHRNITQATLNGGLWVADEAALKIARMYDATFDRPADSGGLAVWTANLKGGMSMLEIATAFAASAEFTARYGAVTNEQFIRQMYQFCLNRETDGTGLAFWVDALNNGTSRAQMLVNFSESAEHVALMRELWIGGIRTTDSSGTPAEDYAKTAGAPLVLPDIDAEQFPITVPTSPGFTITDKNTDAFVLPAVPDMPLSTVDPTDPFNGLDIAALRTSVAQDNRMMLFLPEDPDWAHPANFDAWVAPQRDGHWLM